MPEIWSPDGGWEKLPDQREWAAEPPDSSRRIPNYAQIYLLRDGRHFFSGGCYGGNEGLGPCLVDIAARTFEAVGGLHDHAERTTATRPPACCCPRPRSSGADEDRVLSVNEAETYDPRANTWTLCAAARVIRLYHSVALLLADGTVVTAGSNPDRGDEEYRLERYYPPYLFRGPRPHITEAPGHLHHGETTRITTPQAGDIRRVNLTRAGSTTHCLNTDQRLVDVPFVRDNDAQLTMTVPDSPNLAPPGWYLLTVTDTAGVPSVGRWVQLGH